jgi:hypothetical protein
MLTRTRMAGSTTSTTTSTTTAATIAVPSLVARTIMDDLPHMQQSSIQPTRKILSVGAEGGLPNNGPMGWRQAAREESQRGLARLIALEPLFPIHIRRPLGKG